MVWPDHKLLKWARNGGVDPLDEKLINPTSIDLRLGHEMMGKEDFGQVTFSLTGGQDHLIRARSTFLCHTLETVCIPRDTIGLLTLKSSRGRDFWSLHHMGLFDPGFKGQAVCEITFHKDVYVTLGMPFVQLILMDISWGGVKASYDEKADSHYMNSKGAQGSNV